MWQFQRKRISSLLLPGFFLVICATLFTSCSANTPAVDVSKVDTLSITVKRIAPGTSSILFQRISHDPSQIQYAYQTITALHQVMPGEIYNCPYDSPTYAFYDVRFQNKGMLVAEMTHSETGCYFWDMKASNDPTTLTYCCLSDQTQWIQWQKALNIPPLTVPPTH